MMMTNRKFFLILLLITFSVNSHSQDDFGLWLTVDASHKVFKSLNAEISGSLRTVENSSVIDQYFGEAGLSYKFGKIISVSSSYRLIKKVENNSEYYFRHKFYLGTRAEIKTGRFDFSARMLYQRTVHTYIENKKDLIPQNLMRLRVKAEYKIISSPFKPYLSCEPYLLLNDINGSVIQKNRISAGTEVRITSKSSIEAGYIFENFKKSQSVDSHIISLKYILKF